MKGKGLKPSNACCHYQHPMAANLSVASEGLGPDLTAFTLLHVQLNVFILPSQYDLHHIYCRSAAIVCEQLRYYHHVPAKSSIFCHLQQALYYPWLHHADSTYIFTAQLCLCFIAAEFVAACNRLIVPAEWAQRCWRGMTHSVKGCLACHTLATIIQKAAC